MRRRRGPLGGVRGAGRFDRLGVVGDLGSHGAKMSESLTEGDYLDIVNDAESAAMEWASRRRILIDTEMGRVVFQEILRSMLTEARDFEEAEGFG